MGREVWHSCQASGLGCTYTYVSLLAGSTEAEHLARTHFLPFLLRAGVFQLHYEELMRKEKEISDLQVGRAQPTLDCRDTLRVPAGW